MAKENIRFVCRECGHESIKWLGKCPGCGNWNTLMEENLSRQTKVRGSRVRPIALTDIPQTAVERFTSGIGELDQVLGGGIVPGSLVLLGGDPGIGKSTLLLQVADWVSRNNKKVLYLSGEESAGQIRLRSQRLGIKGTGIFFLNEQNVEMLADYVQEVDPELIIIDSIQAIYAESISSIPGSVTQLRECTARIMDLAKKNHRAFFLIGHVTKDGVLAGPKVLEHMVDVVIYFEGEKQYSFRILRGIKNRFGSTNEIGLLEMSGTGLKEVLDPSQIFLTSKDPSVCGSAVTVCFEGSRPFLIEIQTLVSPAGTAYPRRMASGIDQNRLALIIAVLEKRCGIQLSSQDVYLKVTGGVFLRDPSIDLGIAAAIISSYREKPISMDTVFIGELGLSGEIRSAPFLDGRMREAIKMGFKKALVPAGLIPNETAGKDLEVVEVRNLDDFIEIVGG